MKSFRYFFSVGVLLVLSACATFMPQKKVKEVKTLTETTPPPPPPPPPAIVHEAHLSSDWYNQIPTQLQVDMNNYLTVAQQHFYVEADPQQVRALVVPHAGYFYSGLCAASAYQTLLATRNLASIETKNQTINKVVILAPSHSAFFTGIALPLFDRYRTVLGDLIVDKKAIEELSKTSFCKPFPEAFEKEHALEIQLPWIQKTIAQCTIVPLIVGHIKDLAAVKDIAVALKKIVDEKTLVVVSSDFVHHGERFEYQLFKKNITNQIKLVDSLAIEAISKGSALAFERMLEDTNATICGKNPIKILLALQELGALGNVEPRLASYYTSAHLTQARRGVDGFERDAFFNTVPDDKAQHVVSYAGLVFVDQRVQTLSLENRLTGYEKQELLHYSRDLLTFTFNHPDGKNVEAYPSVIMSSGMNFSYGAFVSLKTKKGDLRGCIGHTYAYQPLIKTITALTKSAAFEDKRFAPLKKEELNDVIIDITILSRPQRVNSPDDIIVGKHGVSMNKFKEDGSMVSAVFLPQVAREQKWDRDTMLEQLSLKAGLQKDEWRFGADFYTFEGYEFNEQ